MTSREAKANIPCEQLVERKRIRAKPKQRIHACVAIS
jgi:hypothetical protein